MKILKRIGAILLSLNMTIVSLSCANLEVAATEIFNESVVETKEQTLEVADEALFEDESNDDLLDLLDNVIFDYKLDEIEKFDLTRIALTYEDEKYVFAANNNDLGIEMIISSDKEECIIKFSSCDGEFISTEKVEEIANELHFENEINEVFSIEGANEFFVSAMNAWEMELKKNELTFADLGFDAWNKYIISIEESEADSLDEEELVSEVLDENDIISEQIIDDTVLEETDIVEDETCDVDIELEQESIVSVDEDMVLDDIIDDATEEIEEINIDLADDAMESTMPVIDEVERVSFNYPELTMEEGETVKLIANYYPENANVSVTWLDNGYSTYVSVSPDGTVKAKKYTASPISVACKINSKTFNVPITIKHLSVPYYYNEDWEPVRVGDEIITDNIWVANFQQTANVYTGKPVTQKLSVYCGNKLLTLNKDYTLKYKNNINAAPYDLVTSPSVTITMKGNYTGKKTLYYAIDPKFFDMEVVNTTANASLVYNKKVQKFVPTLMYNGKKLINNKDFTIEYTSTDFVGSEGTDTKVDYVINGIGNFTSTIYGSYYIASKEKSLNKAKITGKSTYKYTGDSYSAVDVCKALDLKIKYAGDANINHPEDDLLTYNIYFAEWPINNIGTGKLCITYCGGVDSHYGQVYKTFKVVPAYSLAKVAKVTSDFKSEITFNKDKNLNVQPSSVGLELIDSSVRLSENIDYTVQYSSNSKVGTATVIYKGIGAYSGTIKKTYKLVNDSKSLSPIPVNPTVAYTQGGAKPQFMAVYTDKGVLLEEGIDYTVSCTNNNNVGTAQYKITGKGNYSKLEPFTGTFDITQSDIANCSVSVSDKAYSAKAGAFKSIPVITAPNGKKLVAGKDYDKEIEYIYNDWDVSSSSSYDCPPAGSLVNVKIKGINNYSGSVMGCYKVYDSSDFNLSKLYISIDDKVYTGKNVEIDLNNDVHIYPTANDLKNKTHEITSGEAADFLRIKSYKNNLKPGKATVVLGSCLKTGAHAFGGTKTVSFKIVKKNYSIPNAVTDISLDKDEISLVSTTSLATDVIKATLNPTDARNKNISWKSSNPSVVEITSVTGMNCYIKAKAAGSITITATTQDGAKVATCKVTSVLKPLIGVKLSENEKTMAIDTTANLTYTLSPTDAYIGTAPSVAWSSSDSSIATVDSSGKIKAITPGEAIITLEYNGKSDSCKVKVTGPPPIEKLVLNKDSIKIDKDSTFDLSYTVLPMGAHTTTPVWTSSDSSVATVSSTGKVTAQSYGDAVITLTVYNMTTQCLVKVKSNSVPAHLDITDASEYTGSVKAAVADDDISDSTAIRIAFNKIRDTDIDTTVVYIPAGVFDLGNAPGNYASAERNYYYNRKLHIVMHPDAVLKMSPGGDICDCLGINGCKYLSIEGGTIDGNLANLTHDPSKNSSGSGIYIRDSEEITIDGVTIINCPGAGITIGGAHDVTKNVTIKNCVISGCKGSGIIIDQGLDNINISNCIIKDNGYNAYSYGGYGISIMPSDGLNAVANNVSINNCLFFNNKLYDFIASKGTSSAPVSVNGVAFDNCYFYGKIYIGTGKNITFTNTKHKPSQYTDKVKNSLVFPD